MKAICPNCGSEEIVGADVLLASCGITTWDKSADGEMTPEWNGNTEVHWDSSKPEVKDKPYCCVACTTYYAASELNFEEEGMREDDETEP